MTMIGREVLLIIRVLSKENVGSLDGSSLWHQRLFK